MGRSTKPRRRAKTIDAAKIVEKYWTSIYGCTHYLVTVARTPGEELHAAAIDYGDYVPEHRKLPPGNDNARGWAKAKPEPAVPVAAAADPRALDELKHTIPTLGISVARTYALWEAATEEHLAVNKWNDEGTTAELLSVGNVVYDARHSCVGWGRIGSRMLVCVVRCSAPRVGFEVWCRTEHDFEREHEESATRLIGFLRGGFFFDHVADAASAVIEGQDPAVCGARPSLRVVS